MKIAMPDLTIHGTFGTFMGDVSEPQGIHSSNWTHIRSQKHKGKEKKDLSKANKHCSHGDG
jgi:hypothetical protein